MCGRNAEVTDAVVEGVIMKVCSDCARFGHVISLQPSIVKEEQRKVREKRSMEIHKGEEIVDGIRDDYAKVIKQAREKKGLKQEELAMNIAEKESLIHSMESGSIKPSFKTAKKLEVFLGIKLIEKYEKNVQETKDINFRDKAVTIGDLLRAKKDE